MIIPEDLDLDTASREEIVEKLMETGAYSQEAAEAIADLLEDGEPLL